MSGLRVLLVITLAFHVAVAYSSRGRYHKSRCVKITNKVAPLCVNISVQWTSMKLPNLLDHDTEKEVKQELSQWRPLANSGCHPYLKHFLCTVYAPMCMHPDQPPLMPCQSLCSMVQHSCEPLMIQHNYTWPAMVNCSKYQENDMCVRIPSLPTPSPPTTKPTVAPRSACVDDMNVKVPVSILKKKFCEADFAFRGRVLERKDRYGSVILKIKVGTQMKSPRSLKSKLWSKLVRLRVPISSPTQCKGAQKRKQFLVFGKFKKGKKMVVTHLLKWKKWKRFARKLSKLSCRRI